MPELNSTSLPKMSRKANIFLFHMRLADEDGLGSGFFKFE